MFEFVLFMLDNITLAGSETQLMSTVVSHSQLFLRNVSFTRSNKLHFLSTESFLPCLLSFITSQAHPPRTRAYAVATLWMILFNHQGVKAALNRAEVVGELQLLR